MYGDIRDTSWTVFKIELVQGWDLNILENIETKKERVIEIAQVLKTTAKSKFIESTEVKFVESNF